MSPENTHKLMGYMEVLILALYFSTWFLLFLTYRVYRVNKAREGFMMAAKWLHVNDSQCQMQDVYCQYLRASKGPSVHALKLVSKCCLFPEPTTIASVKQLDNEVSLTRT